jgi:hypothetical protein
MQSDGKVYFLVIGASPASLKYDTNVFGDLDIKKCAAILIEAAQKALQVILPWVDRWQCRRIDITGNYLLPTADDVKQALRMLMNSDAARRRPSSMKRGGDTVQWNATSDLSKGKAYHKGPQLQHICNRLHLNISVEKLEIANRLLRLEHTRGARWFRRYEAEGKKWYMLNPEELAGLYVDFFGRLVNGTLELTDMERDNLIAALIEANGITPGRAEAAFTTFRNIREDGYEVVKGYMPRSTFYKHMKYLRAIGVTDSDMHIAKVIPIRPVRIVLARPVASWEDIRRAA